MFFFNKASIIFSSFPLQGSECVSWVLNFHISGFKESEIQIHFVVGIQDQRSVISSFHKWCQECQVDSKQEGIPKVIIKKIYSENLSPNRF